MKRYVEIKDYNVTDKAAGKNLNFRNRSIELSRMIKGIEIINGVSIYAINDEIDSDVECRYMYYDGRAELERLKAIKQRLSVKYPDLIIREISLQDYPDMDESELNEVNK
jgi:hypothetical protein